ncbi:MAG: exodeoxyribonuclease VII small subunit [Bradymonadia bacterium]
MSDQTTLPIRGLNEEPPPFEHVIRELQGLVDRLESGNLPLDEALALYERGVHLANQGNTLLEGAERRVEELQKDLMGDDL